MSIASVLVAVLTYQRPDGLRDLVELLAAESQTCSIDARVLVVDNNPDGSARELVEGLGLAMVDYVHEPEPGIAAARNCAIARAEDRDAIAFVDDDESPRAGWLQALVDSAHQYDAVAVTGPVIRQYPHPPSDLVDGMRQWDRVRHPSGTTVPAASTANLLLDLRFLRRHDLAFDPDFGLSGGSDTLLTRKIVALGGRLVWSDDAAVLDFVTEERMTPKWLAGRARRVGNTHSRVELELKRGWITRARLIGKGSALAAVGLATAVRGRVVGDPHRQGIGLWRRSRGVGILAGGLGRTHYDYRR